MRHVLAYEAMAAPDATGYVECSGQEVTRGAMADVLQPYDVEALLEAISSIPGWGINSVKLNCAVKTKGPIQQIPAWSFHDAGMLTSVYYRKLREVGRDFYPNMPFGPEDMSWAIETVLSNNVLVACVHFGRRVREGRFWYDIFMTLTRDADAYYHAKVQYYPLVCRYFRCDQEQGLRDLIRDLPALTGKNKDQ